MKARSCLLFAGALVLFLLVAAPASSADSKAKLRAAVKAYSAAFLGGHAKRAWLMRTDHANEGMTYPEFRAVCVQAHEIYGDAVMTSLTVDRIKGERALVSYTYDIHDIDQSLQPWRLVDGQWKYNHRSAKSSTRCIGQVTSYVHITDTGTKCDIKTSQTPRHSTCRKTLTWAKLESHGRKP